MYTVIKSPSAQHGRRILSKLLHFGTYSKPGPKSRPNGFWTAAAQSQGTRTGGKRFSKVRKPLKRFCDLFGEVWARLWTAAW